MFLIEINNNALEFDGTLAVILNSPIFSDEISHSLQFTVKNTIQNRKVLGFINMPEIADNKSRELPCIIKADPLSFTGTIVIIYQNGAFNCYFKQNGDFWSAIKDKSIKDLPFDKVIFDHAYDYEDIINFIHEYQENNDHDFTFPVLVNKTVTEKFPVKVSASQFINNPSVPANTIYPVIPCLYIRAVYEAIFKKNGISINKNVFFNSFLSKLVMPNNYLINEFELDTTIVWQGASFICKIPNSTDPTVTTVTPHGLTNYGFIKINFISGMPINNRIFQIEVIDDTNFKILNEDFSNYPEYNRNFYLPTSVVKENNGQGVRRIKFIPSTAVTQEDIDGFMAGTKYIYFRSTDYCCKYAGYNIDGNIYVYPDWCVPTDPNYDSHSYSDAVCVIKEGEYEGFEGVLQILPALLINKFNGIDPSNHLPDITIKDFLDQCRYLLGLIPILRDSNCDIKTFKEILSSPDFIEISQYSQRISDIENPNMDGYLMKMQADASDTFYKQMMPVESIDSKYTVKNPATNKANLPITGSETDDVRLVTNENTYYVFNKSFLNADNNWKLLCYNLLDMQSGNGDLKIDTKFSPLLPYLSSQGDIVNLQFDINCRCKNFDNELKMSPRIIIYYGVFIINNQRTVVSNYKAWNLSGIIPSDNFSIQWDGIYGLKEKIWKEYIEWQLNVKKDCIVIIQWPMYLLADFDFSKKYRIRNIDYLIKSIKFTLNFKNQRVEFNETELAKV